ncbi:hypothetical protein OBCHQ24_13845 [Oceanobacillus iheyensis]|nr:hypothetical protein OBCHQ24_13845 [Oceanobacillus iheyensis]
MVNMEMKLNYALNEEDIDTFVENLYTYSKYDRKQKFRVLSFAIGVPILGTVLVERFKPGIPDGIYIIFIILGFYLMYKTGLDDIKRDNKKAIMKKNERFIGEREAILTEDHIKMNFTGSKKETTNLWEDVDFYNRENENIFIYIEDKSIVHQLKVGNRTDEVEDFLQNIGVNKKV